MSDGMAAVRSRLEPSHLRAIRVGGVTVTDLAQGSEQCRQESAQMGNHTRTSLCCCITHIPWWRDINYKPAATGHATRRQHACACDKARSKL